MELTQLSVGRSHQAVSTVATCSTATARMLCQTRVWLVVCYWRSLCVALHSGVRVQVAPANWLQFSVSPDPATFYPDFATCQYLTAAWCRRYERVQIYARVARDLMPPHICDSIAISQPGDALPDVTVWEGTPDGAINVKEVFAGKKGILFGVPGAFTPGCSRVRAPQ